MPSYVVEPPDILLFDTIRVVPKPPYRLQPLDNVLIQATNVLPNDPIGGLYAIDPDGTVNLGLAYGTVKVVGMTLTEAASAIKDQLVKGNALTKAEVNVALAQSRGVQQVSGQHLVRPDGTVSLGLYGSVRVAGLTLPEVKAAVEAYLSQYLEKPEIAVDVLAYNSKVYYLIYDTAGTGEQVVRLPVTGNETVLDAVANLYGLSPVANRCRVFVVRPSPACHACDQVLPVEWEAIVRRGRTDTNYQLLPGDRVYVEADPLITFDTRLSRLLNPFERMFGFTLLGAGTVGALHNVGGNGNGGGGG
jgi:polysaccharide export outer membrane protein